MPACSPYPQVRPLPHPACAELDLVRVLHALAHPVRLLAVRRLGDSGVELANSDLELPVSSSTVTHHLGVLREAGVVNQRYEGTCKLNSVRAKDLDARFPGLLRAVLLAGPSE